MSASGGSRVVADKDCTVKCHSKKHGALLLSCVTKGSCAEIRSYTNWLCYNFDLVTDEFGRNLLHMAASTGKWEIVEWLIEKCHCSIDVRDSESGWTALHRSFFYGQITVAHILLNHGANLYMTDHDGYTPLDLITEDRLPYVEYNMTYPQDVYVWGANTNFNLGFGDEQSRSHPEMIELFHKENMNIKQVIMCKYHTVFLTNNGRLLTCGHGHGGRLGQGSEMTELTPSPVLGLGGIACQQVAAGQDHLLLLMEGGQVWSCGLNLYHQLGHTPPPERLVKPKPLSLKFLKGQHVLGVCAARFHSVFYTKDAIFTFGLNAGQLGHPKGPHTMILPHQVSSVYNEGWNITHVTVSDGSTVCATNRGDVFVLHEFQHRKIASKQLDISKLCVVGGHLDSTCVAAGLREGGGMDLRVMLLTRSGKIFLWQQSNPYLRRCLFTSNRQLILSDIHLNHSSVAMVTHNNQGYLGTIAPFKERKADPSISPVSPKSPKSITGINYLLEREDCYFIRAKRLPYIHRASLITSDSKGRDFAVLQTSPKVGLLQLPVLSDSTIQQNFARFIDEASINDAIHDVIIEVGKREFAAHKYILSCRSEYFRKQLTNIQAQTSDVPILVLENINPEAFEQVLKYLYSNSCDFLIEGREIKWGNLSPVENGKLLMDSGNNNNNNIKKITSKKKKTKTKSKDELDAPLKYMKAATSRLGINLLTKALEHIELVSNKVHIIHSRPQPALRFDSKKMVNLCDVRLISKEGVDFPCHKCVLVARSDYFLSMLGSSCWIEKSHMESLTLPIPSAILDVLLKYFYSDADFLCTAEDPEFLCNVLATADQLLIPRLKEMCEVALVCQLTLKNAAEILQLACIYNAQQLKTSCMEYVCINLPALVETKALDVISDDVMEELNRTYQNMVHSMCHRVITPYQSQPSREELQDIQGTNPIDDIADMPRQKLELSETKVKVRRRLKSASFKAKVEGEETRMRCESESSEKSITSNIMSPNSVEIKEFKEKPSETSNPKDVKVKKAEPKVEVKKPVPNWTSSILQPMNPLSLDEIMKNERMIQLNKSNPSEMKRFPHLSQKQKKQMATSNNNNVTQCAVSPKSNCPWAKINESPTPMPSVWDTPNKECRKSEDLSPTKVKSPSSPFSAEPLTISLEAIQKAEEEELRHNTVKPKIKPLHLINIEDQAIEELLLLYQAEGNPKERIVVSRVLPERISKPTWGKHASVPLFL